MSPSISVPTWAWVTFHVVVLAVLALDLGLVNRKGHAISLPSALGWTSLWVALSLGFCGLIWNFYGGGKALEFLTGYVVEYALSVDNIFVFILVFGYFKVPPQYQHRVLFWGIIGAFVMRGAMIFAGTELIHRYEWIIYIFGAFLLYTGVKLAFSDDEEVDPGNNPALKFLSRIMPVSSQYDGNKFTTQIDGKRFATPLLAVLLVVETTDLIFAIDSIPAVIAITHDRFIVYTSNICAILGLRSLYFVVSGVMGLFHYLKYGLAMVLSFIGVKMLISHFYKIPIGVSLGIIVSVLAGSILLSILRPVAQPETAEEAGPVELADHP